ncbi:MAG: LysM peptidoglycan-binding domain-containing protein [Ardenticatenales bacterium]
MAGDAHCSVCGTRIPWRLTRRGILAESAAAIVGLAAIFAAVSVWRASDPGQTPAPPELVAQITEAPFRRAIATLPPATAPVSATLTPLPPPTAAPPSSIEHTIASGDTLWNLANANDTTVDAILAANVGELSLDRLSVGQVIKIPLDGDVAVPPPAPSEPAPAEVAAEPTAAATIVDDAVAAVAQPTVVVTGAVSITVAAADTLSTLAEANGVAVDDVVAANALTGADALIQPGQVLVMKTAVVVTATPEPGANSFGQPGGTNGQAAQAEPMSDGDPTYAAPLALSPLAASTVVDDAPTLRWTSIGPLPPNIVYFALIRGADEAASKATRVPVRGGSTALRIPARYRPALGASRRLAWAVAVGRVGQTLLGSDGGLILSGDPNWIEFTWSAGEASTPSPAP